MVGDPINASNGNKFLQQNDFIDPNGWLTFRRFYNSLPVVVSAAIGSDWRESFDRTLILNSDTSISAVRPDGREESFSKSNGAWTSDSTNTSDLLTENLNAQDVVDGYSLFISSLRIFENYDTQGKLISATDEAGLGISLEYSNATTDPSIAPNPGLLISVTDSKGRQLNFTYNSDGYLVHTILPDGGELTYSHDGSGNLTSVQYPDNNVRQYVYNESNDTVGIDMPHAMTGVIDETGARYETTKFNYNEGFATSTSLANGVDSYYVTWDYDDNGGSLVHYPLGKSYLIGMETLSGRNLVSKNYNSCNPQCNQPWKTISYDSNGYPSTSTDFNGNVTKTTYDNNGLLIDKIDASGTTDQRTTQISWDSALRVPLRRTVTDANDNGLSDIAWVYNSSGEPLAKCVIDDSVAASYVCSDSGTPPAGVRRWTYTYCDAVDGTQCPLVGLLLSATGPRTDLTQTTSYSYYMDSVNTGCGTPGGACRQAGDLYQVTDALGHVMTIDSYDADGHITQVTDPNGVHTDMTYTSRGWLASRSVGGATTSFTYTPYGAVASITDPDGITTSYTYDEAHRLTDITDAQGNSIHYKLDAAGNKTQEEILDSNGVVQQSTSHKFNAQGELTSVVDGLNQTVFTANFSDSYDADGNLVHSANANSIERKMGYDALNRLDSVIRNYNGTDQTTSNTESDLAYDAMDRIEGVSDPDNLSTIYTYDGLGNRTALQSPDTGSSTDTYDAAGNLLTHTDAKGQVSTSAYDALDRITSTQYADSTLDIAYHYDEPDSVTGCSGSASIGRLTRIVKGDTTTTYCYDARGNVTRKTQDQNGTIAAIQYTYSDADRLLSVQYPDTTLASYAYDTTGRVQSISLIPPDHTQETAIAAVSSITYLPFGPIASYALANGQTVTRTYNANYRLTDLTSPLLNLHYARDALGNITAMGDAPGADPATESYTYDPLQRLTGVVQPGGTTIEGYTYNKTGDRLSKTGNGESTGTYTYASGTHHLIQVGTDPYAVDANGETTALQRAGQSYTFTYNDRRRMATAQVGTGNPANYVYNTFGERIRKATDSGTEHFAYDEAGHLLSRSQSEGTRDYIWLGGMPVALVDEPAAGGASTESYILDDDLGSPRVVTDAIGNEIWSWVRQGNPFGEQEASSATGFVFDLRFTGQYFDSETSLDYNINREYSPDDGRYIQSDPIGLLGGSSGYAFVSSNPLLYTDFLGLTDLNLFPKGSAQWIGANHFKSPSGTFVVGAHGNPILIVDSHHIPLTAYQLARLIRRSKNYHSGETVLLLSCNTGVVPGKGYAHPTKSFAQVLANALKAHVQAPNNFAWIRPNGLVDVAGETTPKGPVSWKHITQYDEKHGTEDYSQGGSFIEIVPTH